MSSKLQLKNDDTDGPAVSCPNCGSPMAAEAVICLQCGYDKRTGKAPGADDGKKQSPVILAALCLLIIAALAVVFLRSTGSKSAAPAPSSPAPASAVQEPPPAAAVEQEPAQTEPAVPAVEPPAPAPAAPEPSAAEAPVAPAPAPEAEVAEPAIDWEAIAASHFQRLATELDKRAPLFEIGAAAELRLTNGVIYRGIYQRFADGEIHLQVKTNESRSIAVESLDRGTRVRVEPEYRQKYLEYLVRQRVAQEKAAAEQRSAHQ